MSPTVVSKDAPVVDAKSVGGAVASTTGFKVSASDSDPSAAASDNEDTDTRPVDAAPRPWLSATISMDDSYLREMPEGAPSPRTVVRRSKSCGVHSGDGKYRIRIDYHDEQLRERSEHNTRQLLQAAFDEASANSTSAILARKALRYRKILQRMEEANINVNDPAFDAAECLGVRWRRVSSE
jgi:hypothetical protein